MNLAYADHGHTLHAALSPPVEGEGGVQESRLLPVAIAHKIGVLVHIGTLCISERTPADGDEVRLVVDVEVAIHAVLKTAMVYPAVRRSGARQQVAAPHVDAAWSHKADVAHDDVRASAERQHTGIAETLRSIARLLYKYPACVVFRLFAHPGTIGQCSSTSVGVHLGHSGLVQRLPHVCRHVPSGTQSCPIDAQQRLVAHRDIHPSCHHEVTFAAIQDDDIVVFDSILYRLFHINIRPLGGQHRHSSGKSIRQGISIAAAPRNMISTGSIAA